MPELTLDLTLEQITLVLAGVAALAVICFLFAIVLGFKLRRLRKRLTGGDLDLSSLANGKGDGLATLGRSMKRVDSFDQRVDELTKMHEEQAAISRFALQRFAIVRYDAFEDMGGRLSFSCALLDDHGDGIVFTSINGRTETRTYAKPVEKMGSSHNLSEEEREAIATAVAGPHRSASREGVSQSL